MSDDEELKRPEKPPEDADAAEIARWMEDDFWRQTANGLSEAVEELKEKEEKDEE